MDILINDKKKCLNYLEIALIQMPKSSDFYERRDLDTFTRAKGKWIFMLYAGKFALIE